MNTLSKIRLTRQNQYLISFLSILLVSGICYALSGVIGYKVVAYLLLVSLSILALFFDIIPVVFSALLSAIVWDFFFIPPRFTFRVATAEDFFLLVMYFVIAMVHAVLTYKVKQMQRIAMQKEEKASTLKLYSALLNSLSHELRTPIAAIIGASDNLLQQDSKLSEANKDGLLSEISIAALRLNHQVENLLNMSRLESGTVRLKRDWCDVTELIYTMVQHMEEQLHHHVVDIRIQEDMPLVKLDDGLIEQALYNLVSNAVQYTPAASTIIIRANCKEGICIIAIEDDGQGFPEDETEKVFDKFYRLKHSRTGGTGLGLSIARGFVEAHNGTIRLENAALGGALFTITIPTELVDANILANE